MRTRSKIDKKRLDGMSDKDINLNEIPELSDEFFKNAQIQMPNKQAVTMRLDSDVLEWFKKQGKGYQTRINQLLLFCLSVSTNSVYPGCLNLKKKLIPEYHELMTKVVHLYHEITEQALKNEQVS